MVFESPLMAFQKKFLGVDIGISGIKVVELSKAGKVPKLENYALFSFNGFDFQNFKDIPQILISILKEARIKTKQAIFSLPDFASFFTNLELPPMKREELEEAIRYEARKYLPLPISELTLDWQIIGDFLPEKKIKLLLVAVNNEIINQYQAIARLSQLELWSMEAEIFALMRTLVDKKEKKVVALIDLGRKSTSCSIAEGKILHLSHSFDLSGETLDETIAQRLNIDLKKARELKKRKGLLAEKEGLREILLPKLDFLIKAIERIFQDFQEKEGKKIEKIILTGGGSLLIGLKECFSQHFPNQKIEIANPLKKISYPNFLEEILKELGPKLALAIGLALRGFKENL